MTAIIEIEQLSKQYRLGVANPPLDNLREALLRGLRAPRDVWNGLMRRGARAEGQDSLWALRDVSFSVDEGEVIGIIGANGAGKSTLLKILARITDPTAGTVRIRGRLSSLLEVGTGFHPELTGRDNIYLNGAVLGMRKSEIDARFDAIVDFAEMAAFLDTPVKRYSSGMYVRLAFAVAAHLDPEILIVDEVLAVGDLAFQRKSLGKMGDVSRGGRTILFVSHNMAAVEHLCRTGLVLERGRLAFKGSAKEAVEHYVRNSAVGGPEGESHSVDLTHSVTGPARVRPALRRLRLFTTDDAPLTGSIPIGGHFKAEIAFSLERPAANVDVALRFDDLLGQRILAIGSAFDPGFRGQDRSGDLEAICEVASLILTPGIYRLRVALLVGNAEVDAVEDAARITIVASDYYGTGRIPRAGTFVLPQRWSLR
jgi:lipopolysaccharide transport system ATP-binding protein